MQQMRRGGGGRLCGCGPLPLWASTAVVLKNMHETLITRLRLACIELGRWRWWTSAIVGFKVEAPTTAVVLKHFFIIRLRKT